MLLTLLGPQPSGASLTLGVTEAADKAAFTAFEGPRLSTTDVDGAPTFSNNNKTIASGTDNVWQAARSNVGSSNKFYFEMLVGSSSSNNAVGVTNGTQSLSTFNGVEPNKGIGIYGDGYFYSDNVPAYDQFSATSGANGDRICVAVDPVNGKLWARRNNGNWNNSATDNPATNTGGKNISDFGSTLYIVGLSKFTYISTTVYMLSTDWSYSAPSGFTQITPAVPYTASLAATEGSDTAAFAVPHNISLSAAEGSDTAAFSASTDTVLSASLAATEAGDAAAFSVTAQSNASLAATEAGDTAAFTGSVGSVLNASLAATEAGDTATLNATAQTDASLAATEAGDTAAFVTRQNITFAATEGTDTALFSVGNTAAFAATEGVDTAALSVTARTNATLGVIEGTDTAAFVVDVAENYGFDAGGFFDGGFNTPPGARLTATEAGDTAAFTFSLNGLIGATEASDAANLVVGNSTRLQTAEAGDTAALVVTGTNNALLAVEGSDTAAFSASARTNAALASSEAGDTAAILANNALSVVYAVTEAGDTAAFAVTARTSVSFSVTEAQDQAALTVLPQVLGTLASTEAQDLASIGYSVYTSISYDDAEVLYADPEQQPFPVGAEGRYLVVPVEVRVMMSDGYPAPFDSEPRRRPQ